MAINPSPVANQMQAFGNTDQVAVTATSTPSFLQTQPQPTSQVMAPPGLSTAQQILQKEGVSSARQLLDSMKVPSAKDILAGAGIPSAKDILEKEGLKVQRQQKFQEEMDLRQKELEYMKNYKFDANTFNPTTYETKYGNLDFKEAKLEYDTGWSDENNYYSYNFDIDGTKYVFMPEELAMRGLKGTDNKQRVNYAFLDKTTWEALAETAQIMDLSNMDMSSLQTVNPTQDPRRQFNQDDVSKVQGRGFLFSKEDWQKFKTEHLDDSWRAWGAHDPNYGLGKNQYGGDIKGISQLPSGELIYVTQPSGGHDQVNTYINSKGEAWLHWYDKPSGGGIIGDFVRGVGNLLSDVPLLPEIIALTVPGGAQFYPAMKGSQVVAAGGDLGDVLVTMGTAYVATSPVMQNATASLTETFTSTLGATGAKVAAGAVVGTAYAGTVAALTGQDVEKAMLAGALSGGIQAGTPEIANAMFGDSATIDKLANSVGLTRSQFQNIAVSSMGNAAIGAAVYNKDFFEIFSQDLVTKGLSVSAANKVKDNMMAKNKDPAAIQRMVKGTQMIVAATARSAVRGTDINVELERAFQKFGEGEILRTAANIGKQ